MARLARPVIASRDGKQERVFPSVREAADALGVSAQVVYNSISNFRICKGYELKYYKPSKKKIERVQPEIIDTRRKPSKTYTAVIEGRTFQSVIVPQMKKCTECDIFKMRPPQSMAALPLCYDYSSGKRKIVSLCQSFRIIWEEI